MAPRGDKTWLPRRLFWDYDALAKLYELHEPEDLTLDEFGHQVRSLPPEDIEQLLIPWILYPHANLVAQGLTHADHALLSLRIRARMLTEDDVVDIWHIATEMVSLNKRWTLKDFEEWLASVPSEEFLDVLESVAIHSEKEQLVFRTRAIRQTRLQEALIQQAQDISHATAHVMKSLTGNTFDMDTISLNNQMTSLKELIPLQGIIDTFRQSHLFYKNISVDQSFLETESYLDDIKAFVTSLGLSKAIAENQVSAAYHEYMTIRSWLARTKPLEDGRSAYDPSRFLVLKRELLLKRRPRQKRKREDSPQGDESMQNSERLATRKKKAAPASVTSLGDKPAVLKSKVSKSSKDKPSIALPSNSSSTLLPQSSLSNKLRATPVLRPDSQSDSQKSITNDPKSTADFKEPRLPREAIHSESKKSAGAKKTPPSVPEKQKPQQEGDARSRTKTSNQKLAKLNSKSSVNIPIVKVDPVPYPQPSKGFEAVSEVDTDSSDVSSSSSETSDSDESEAENETTPDDEGSIESKDETDEDDSSSDEDSDEESGLEDGAQEAKISGTLRKTASLKSVTSETESESDTDADSEADSDDDDDDEEKGF